MFAPSGASLVTPMIFAAAFVGLQAVPAAFESPDLSPDGGQVACMVGFREPGDRRLSRREIWVINAASGAAQPIVTEGMNLDPRWSRDGKKIVFRRVNYGTRTDLFVVDADGKNERQLTNTGGLSERGACFSPDGSSVYYLEGDGQPGSRLMSIPTSGGEAKEILPRTFDPRDLDVFPDGRVMYVGSRLADGKPEPPTEGQVGSRIAPTGGTPETILSLGAETGQSISMVRLSKDASHFAMLAGSGFEQNVFYSGPDRQLKPVPGAQPLFNLSISGDGQLLAMSMSREGKSGIWLYRPSSGAWSLLRQDPVLP